MAYLFLAIAIFCEVVGTTALKLSFGFTRLGPSVLTVVGYGAAFYFLAIALKTLNVGFAYAVWSGVGTALIALIAVLWFAEAMPPLRIASLAMVIAGVIGLHLS